MRLCLLAAFTLAWSGPLLADVPLHNFDDLSAWRPNADGGHPPQFSLDREHAREGAAMRIRYTDRPPHWGNLTAPCRVPPDARALRFWVYKHSAEPQSALHIWLFEPDDDAWLQQVRFRGRSLPEAPVGWHEIRLPVSAFRFQPRGRKTREMTSADRMLIGCNFGDLEVTIDSMAWETGTEKKKLPLPKTDDLKIEAGERGSVAILDLGPGLPDGFQTAHPPAKLADALRAGGFGVTILQPGDLADETILTPAHFAAVVLPWGPYFPLEARDAFVAYLKGGGSFLSTDGYAFDQLVVLTEAGWSSTGPEVRAEQMAQPPPPPPDPMNTRTGKPGDQMSLRPDQIGVFDPSFRLQHAQRFRLAEWYGEQAVAGGPQYEFPRPVQGFSACGLTGYTSAVFPPVYRRWVPVLQAFDGTGRALRGTALSILHNYAGPFSGSSWAFSGLTDRTDIFLGDAGRRELLCRVLTDITEKVFLHELTTDFACYEPGETARISVRVSNYGRRPAARVLSLRVADRELLSRRLDLQPGEARTVEASIPVDDLGSDYCPVQARLYEGERLADFMESGLCIRSEAILASGPQIGWKDNYLTVDGRPTFLLGTNQTGMMFFSANENPAIWDRDFRTMQEHNFHILRILHFSPFSKGGYEGKPTNQPLHLAERPRRLVRQLDAIVQLAQKHRVAIFLSLHDWMGTTLTDEELQAQADWNRFWAERYKDVPGIFYDIQNEPSVRAPDRPDIVALWNSFLQQRYGSDEALRAAWTRHPPEKPLPTVPLGPTSNDWDDTRSADRKRFETVLLNRWIKANLDGIKAGDPDALVTVGYLPSMPPADKILGVAHTDFSNMHYYGPVDRFPLEFKLIDRRFVGKGLSLGECGAREAHDSRTHGHPSVPVADSIHRFQTYIHYAAGLGAAFICNWDWKDFDEMVFPWGLMHHCSNITKPWLHTWEQGSLLLSLVEPTYESPEIFILAPDSHRIGPRFNELTGALHRSVALLLDRRVNFGMINEEDLNHLPPSAKALVWPLPYCPADETFARVLKWVQAGGTLYLSGDLSFDRTRRPTRLERRRQLGLPEATPTSPFDTPENAWHQAPIETSVRAGKVLFVPYPLELRPQPTDAGVYQRLIALAGVSPITVEPAEAPVRALSLPTREGGRLYMLARRSEGANLLPVTLPNAALTVNLAEGGFAFVLLGPQGEIRAAESQGPLVIGGKRLASAEGHYALCALDGRDLRRTQQLLVLPHQCTTVDIGGLPQLRDAHCFIGPSAGSPRQVGALVEPLVFPPGASGQVAVVAPADQLDAALARLRALSELRF